MIQDINILLLGTDTPHHPDFITDKTDRGDLYVLMCFSTPFFSRTMEGIEIGEPGDCIIHDPAFPQFHGTINGMSEGFRNDWMHLSGMGVNKLLVDYGLPVNRIIRSGESHLLTSLFREIEAEFLSRKPYWENKINLLLEEIFLLIGRYYQLTIELENYTPIEREFKKKFNVVRAHIHSHFQYPWSIKNMSDMLSLSTNRFTVLYRKYFKISPKDDLINKRIEEAKICLVSSNASIEQIALNCGFSSLYYFSRIFKQRVGSSPTSFRK